MVEKDRHDSSLIAQGENLSVARVEPIEMMDSQTEKLTEPLGLSLLDGGGVFSTW